jgi:hypothetical protein
MINAKKRKGRAYFQIPSNKVDSIRKYHLTSKFSTKRDSIREAKNVNTTSNNTKIGKFKKFITKTQVFQELGRTGKVFQGIQN